jgi:quercetin dioxygenase-like cupin family protein
VEAIQLRTDPAVPARVVIADEPWVPSPEPGVDRVLLERDGGEVARATSIVRYAAGSRFPPHVHERGEELLVLAGTFSDEAGDYPAGTYLRNPPGSRHAPFSVGGATIFVKLRTIPDDDRARVVVRPDGPSRPGRRRLHAHGRERVELVRLAAGETVDVPAFGELFVVEGELAAGVAWCPAWTWLRTARAGVQLGATTAATVWLKQGHLGHGS